MLLLEWLHESSPAQANPLDHDSVGSSSNRTRGKHASCLVNLGDSRTVVANFRSDGVPSGGNGSSGLTQTRDVNSSVSTEREYIMAQHPLDDPRDVIVGGRLFGETLSTRAFGDALYKLPLRRTEDGETVDAIPRRQLSAQEKALHCHYVHQMSACLVDAEASRFSSSMDGPGDKVKRRPRTIALGERYDAMFSSYLTPPYVSPLPEVQAWQEGAVESSEDAVQPGDQDRGTGARAGLLTSNAAGSTAGRMFAILATDGLWDLTSSESAMECVLKVAASLQSSGEELNLAEALYRYVVEDQGRRAGDDVTILVVEYNVSGFLDP
ncbi:uncharacterized protein B0I36DRAFT_354517 [Microdochium trichocladiopsis]|uniref:PPM-type phosphatase domain-containing protein n=1 Tax=Microdochium trichocladiopsis TaxID=1682393 RepID=A0A9P8XTT3_9PEZI|nr:uncharacterized protein B0I36DRAFT_354517 [Microdochium trichocladiopsis]KAH7018215.1 hypothetical protein B0I36DRAFT_354517 [Microdochium trichocladiopsis]